MSVYRNGVHRIWYICCWDKIPLRQNSPKIQNLIYMSVYRNGVQRIRQNCCRDKIPPVQNPPKIQNLIYMCVYLMVYTEYGRVVVGTKSPHDKKLEKYKT